MDNRKKIIIANWKMHKTVTEASDFVEKLKPFVRKVRGVVVMIAAPFPLLAAIKSIIRGTTLRLAAQNLYPGESGPYTGEVSGVMLREFASHVILGHSERRALFGETDALVHEKIKSALYFKLTPVVCIGEDAAQKEKGESKKVVESQLEHCLQGLSEHEAEQLVLTYEPVWAISTTRDRRDEPPEEAQVMHKLIRHALAARYGNRLAEKMTIIYGGSVRPQNVEGLLAMPDIDGGLVGAASLNIESFVEVIQLAAK